MSSLGKILRNLKEKNEGENLIDAQVFKRTDKHKGIRILYSIALFLLFISSVFGGFVLVKFISNIRENKSHIYLSQQPVKQTPNYQSHNTSQESSNINSDNINASSLRGEKINELPKEGPKVTKAINETKIPQKKVKILPVQKSINRAPIKPQQKEIYEIVAKGSSDEKTPILRREKLIENLLINAEEARVKGNLDDAINYYLAYLKHKEDPDVLNNLAGLYLLKGDFKRAEKLLERALNLKEDETFALNLIISLLMQGEVEKACKSLRERQFSPKQRGTLEELNRYCR